VVAVAADARFYNGGNTMTTTRTTVIEGVEPQVLRLKADFRHAFMQLCKEMRDSTLFPPTLIPEDKACQRATLQSLGLFFVNVLDPAGLFYAENGIAFDQVGKFQDALQKIIETELPSKENFKAFLEQCIAETDTRLEEEHIAEIKDKIKDQMVEQANAVNQLMLDQHQKVNNRVKDRIAFRKAAVEEMTGRMNFLEERIERVCSNMQDLAPHFQKLCKNMKEKEGECLQFLSELSSKVDNI
jgi:hypothetical protein